MIVESCTDTPKLLGNRICYRTVPSRASGTPRGSNYGRFAVLWKSLVEPMPGVTQCSCHVFGAPPLCYGVQLWGHIFGSTRPPPIPGVVYLLGLDCGICGLFPLFFTPSCSGRRSWGDLFTKFLPPPPFFHCHKTRGGR